MSTQQRTHTDRPQTDRFDDALERMGVQITGYNDLYPDVDRRTSPFAGSKQAESPELFETLRDALNLESKLRINPPGSWTPVRMDARARSWTGYGHSVHLETSIFGPWTLSVDGELVLEDASRMEAFRQAAKHMRVKMTESQ